VLGLASVESDRPGVDRLDVQMRSAPRISRQRGADSRLGLGIDRMDHPVPAAERTTDDDEPGIDEPVHEGRVLRPAGLLLQRQRVIELRTGLADHDVKHRHAALVPDHTDLRARAGGCKMTLCERSE